MGRQSSTTHTSSNGCPCTLSPSPALRAAARPADGVVRLVGADSPWEGRLEVFHAGDWGTVCSRNWTRLQAQVVCRQLGFRWDAGDL